MKTPKAVAASDAVDPRPRLNAEWHRGHKMPPKATFEQRVEWHREHARHCRCREMPEDIAKAIASGSE